ncbi:hypothetical protein Asi02nite_40600 [Asanoa siamensis]|uniref:Uncharacterized protein n=1 Tax=Asanoa siamensis TaxID=926357 RepID=A0ABQ4CUL0_9ACTN|nr:hypothetical protein Asi02nite_40600 [Asanoa siamensis]
MDGLVSEPHAAMARAIAATVTARPAVLKTRMMQKSPHVGFEVLYSDSYQHAPSDVAYLT